MPVFSVWKATVSGRPFAAAMGAVKLTGRGAGRGSDSDGIDVSSEAQISTTTGALVFDGRAGTGSVAGEGVQVSDEVTNVSTK